MNLHDRIRALLDHLCRVRHCVNPAHLEAVTRRENQRRGFGAAGLNSRKTHCKRGHEFTPKNTLQRGGGRQCRECDLSRKRAAVKTEAARAKHAAYSRAWSARRKLRRAGGSSIPADGASSPSSSHASGGGESLAGRTGSSPRRLVGPSTGTPSSRGGVPVVDVIPGQMTLAEAFA